MSPFFHNFQSKSPAPPPDRRTGRGAIRERLRKAAEPGGVWGVGRTKGKDKGQGHGLELEMDKVRVGGDWGIGGFWSGGVGSLVGVVTEF